MENYNNTSPSRARRVIKGLVGRPLNSNTLLHYNTKSVVYSFDRVNNLNPLLTKIEYLLKSLFLSMYSLISRPIYLIKHDKIIIRLFVFLSPKIDKYLDTSNPTLWEGACNHVLSKRIKGKFLKFKKLRPNTVKIIKSQTLTSITLPSNSAPSVGLEGLGVTPLPALSSVPLPHPLILSLATLH